MLILIEFKLYIALNYCKQMILDNKKKDEYKIIL